MPGLDVVFDELKQNAERLVRAIKDRAHDDAVVLLLEALLEVRRAAQTAMLDEVEARLARGMGREAAVETPDDAP